MSEFLSPEYGAWIHRTAHQGLVSQSRLCRLSQNPSAYVPASRRWWQTDTYVCQMQALGVDLATIQSIVGHADISMTQHYLHVQESIRMDAVDRFSKAFPTGHSDPAGPDEPSCKVLKFPNVG